jgi:glyceraldehyde-3-phosphate dehydrogenase (NADP+)
MAALKFLVGGEWRETARTRPVINPYTGAVVEEVCQASDTDILEAIAAAVEVFTTTRLVPSYRRSAVLTSIATGIASRREEFARLITRETGKPVQYSRAEVDRSIFTFTISAEEARRVEGGVIPLDLAPGSEERFGITRRFPLGPIAAISPFNFPLNLVAHKVGPAIAAGNSIVLKPSSNAPGVALMLGEVITSAGWPAGGFNVLPCASAEACQLIENEAIKLVTFTGSPAVGWPLKAAAGKKRVVLELGGNAGVIVDAGVNLDDAVPRIVQGGFANAGQSCISVQRVFVHESLHESFLERFLAKVRGLPVGDPELDGTVVGPMIDEGSAAQVEGWIRTAVASGAKLYCGGGRKGALLEPTVLGNVRRDLDVCAREVFAPLVTVDSFGDFGDAVRAVNASAYGLQAAVFSNDLSHVLAAYRDLEVGGLVVNDASSYRMDHMPYGGVKDSGFGREGVRYAVEEMTEVKLLCLRVP